MLTRRRIAGVRPGALALVALLAACAPAPRPAPAPAPAVLPPSGPELVELAAAAAEPARVRVGETVNLRLVYELRAGPSGQVSVRQRRSLSLDGRALPNYPVTAQTFRRGGRYTTGYRQTIPPGAAAGTYRFEGEVCVADLCATRRASFEVAP